MKSITCLLLGLLASSLVHAADRPNILFIAVDDLRPEFGAYGADYIKSPNLDRLAKSGDRIHERLAQKGGAKKAVVLTGAMRPYEMRRTDATQNVTEALLAVQVCAPGVYVAMHNRVLQFPGVVKDLKLGTFVRAQV